MSRTLARLLLLAALTLATPSAGEPPALRVGELAPELTLTPLRFHDFRIDERPITRRNASRLYAPVRLSDFRGVRPVALLFAAGDRVASADAERWNALAERWGDRVQLLVIHVSETGDTPLTRIRRANEWAGQRALKAPCLVEADEERARTHYGGAPLRVVLLDAAGRVAHVGPSDSAAIDDAQIETLLPATP